MNRRNLTILHHYSLESLAPGRSHTRMRDWLRPRRRTKKDSKKHIPSTRSLTKSRKITTNQKSTQYRLVHKFSLIPPNNKRKHLFLFFLLRIHDRIKRRVSRRLGFGRPVRHSSDQHGTETEWGRTALARPASAQASIPLPPPPPRHRRSRSQAPS